MRKWTQEARQKQAQLIHSWKPWLNSTGATTFEGKQTSKMNALKHGCYSSSISDLRRAFREYLININELDIF